MYDSQFAFYRFGTLIKLINMWTFRFRAFSLISIENDIHRQFIHHMGSIFAGTHIWRRRHLWSASCTRSRSDHNQNNGGNRRSYPFVRWQIIHYQTYTIQFSPREKLIRCLMMPMCCLQFVRNKFCARFSVILKMMAYSDWFDISETCQIIIAGQQKEFWEYLNYCENQIFCTLA